MVQAQWQVRDDSGRRKYLSGEERVRFLAVADRLGISTRALWYVLTYTGCRISEALALTRHHFDKDQESLTFRTLKRRQIVFRTVPVPDFLARMLQALPTADDGRFWPIHRSTAWRRIKNAMAQASIEGPMATCKGLRHGFAIHAAGRSVPGPSIRRWMGHSSMETTSIYIDAVGVEERQFASRMW